MLSNKNPHTSWDMGVQLHNQKKAAEAQTGVNEGQKRGDTGGNQG
jgi:hypothetical protein